jgi:Fungal protein kinase
LPCLPSPANSPIGLRALYKRGIIHGDISLGNLFLGTTEEVAGFIGDLDLAKVDLAVIKTLFPEWYEEVASSKRGALQMVRLFCAGSSIPLIWQL